jgi:hypothetical protein
VADNDTVSMNRHPETPEVGWAVQRSPEDQARRQAHSGTLRNWLSLRSLLVLVVLLWNGYFLAGTIYELFVQSPSRNQVLAVTVWLWVLGDVAIVIGAVTVRALLRARRNAA